MAIWRALIGESDDNEEDLQGFTLEEMTKGEESDVHLDIVVRGGILESDNELSEDNSVTMVEEMKEKTLVTMMICLCLI